MYRFLFVVLIFLLIFTVYLVEGIELSEKKRSIGIIVHEKWRGEREFAERVRVACERLNWTAKIYFAQNFKDKKHVHDWFLTLVPIKNCCERHNNYLVLFSPELLLFDKTGHLRKDYKNYTGYLSAYANTELLLEDLGGDNQLLYPKPWYPTVQHRDYQRIDPKFLFYSVGQWGNRVKDKKYQIMEEQLSEKDYAKFFGNPLYGKKYGPAFQGPIPFDGVSVLNRITEQGVCLVLHSDIHLNHGMPSGRIFEAASASAVIISDLHPFVLEHFGDSVLYVDQELSGEELFEQIDGHMEWIRNHQEEALQMAESAHQVFEEHFVLENQLLDFNRFIYEGFNKEK